MFNARISTILSLLIITSISCLVFSHTYLTVFFIFLVAAVVMVAAHKVRIYILSLFRSECDRVQEKLNMLQKSIELKQKVLYKAPLKNKKISFLFTTSQKLSELLHPEKIYDMLIKSTAELFGQAENILLYKLEKKVQGLQLIRSWRKQGQPIKEKQGDIVDFWVLRHNSTLLVEDITNDFRFDSNKVIAYQQRDALSFLVSPVAIASRVWATIRVESNKAMQFTLDDLRLLQGMCDLSAVVLERAQLFNRVEELAIRDPLTSLYMRDYFFQRLRQELEHAHDRKIKIGIILLDVDDFKVINDSYGHVVGDVVLQKLAQELTYITSGLNNLISRFGGDEFLAYIVDCDHQQLKEIGEKIRSAIERVKVSFRKKNVEFTASLGMALYPDDGKEVLDLVEKVDQQLYRAKSLGKNKACYSKVGEGR